MFEHREEERNGGGHKRLCDSLAGCRGEVLTFAGLHLQQLYVENLSVEAPAHAAQRLAASVLKCGKRKIWLDPNETNEISGANSRASLAPL
jgi:hypothetical protein